MESPGLTASGLNGRHCILTECMCTVLRWAHDLYSIHPTLLLCRTVHASKRTNNAVRQGTLWCMSSTGVRQLPASDAFYFTRRRAIWEVKYSRPRAYGELMPLSCVFISGRGIYKCRCDERKLSWRCTLSLFLSVMSDGGRLVWSDSEVVVNMPMRSCRYSCQ